MEGNLNKSLNPIEINDLISEAITNAASRRNQGMNSSAPLSELSAEEAGEVSGGIGLSGIDLSNIVLIPPIIFGGFPWLDVPVLRNSSISAV